MDVPDRLTLDSDILMVKPRSKASGWLPSVIFWVKGHLAAENLQAAYWKTGPRHSRACASTIPVAGI